MKGTTHDCCAVCKSGAVKTMCGRCGAFKYCGAECAGKMKELHLAVCLDKKNNDPLYVAEQLERAIVDMKHNEERGADQEEIDDALAILGSLLDAPPGSDEQMDMVDEAKDVLIHHLYDPVSVHLDGLDPMPGLCQLAVARLSQAAKYDERADAVRIEATTKFRRRDSFRRRGRSFGDWRKDVGALKGVKKINALNLKIADAQISLNNHRIAMARLEKMIPEMVKERDRLQTEQLKTVNPSAPPKPSMGGKK